MDSHEWRDIADAFNEAIGAAILADLECPTAQIRIGELDAQHLARAVIRQALRDVLSAQPRVAKAAYNFLATANPDLELWTTLAGLPIDHERFSRTSLAKLEAIRSTKAATTVTVESDSDEAQMSPPNTDDDEWQTDDLPSFPLRAAG